MTFDNILLLHRGGCLGVDQMPVALKYLDGAVKDCRDKGSCSEGLVLSQHVVNIIDEIVVEGVVDAVFLLLQGGGGGGNARYHADHY